MIYVEQCVDDDLERDQHDDDLFGRSTPSLVTHLEDVRMGGGEDHLESDLSLVDLDPGPLDLSQVDGSLQDLYPLTSSMNLLSSL